MRWPFVPFCACHTVQGGGAEFVRLVHLSTVLGKQRHKLQRALPRGVVQRSEPKLFVSPVRILRGLAI